MATPLVDIVVLVHNNLAVTTGFVDKLFANTKNFRLIFVDNGSSDGVMPFLKNGAARKTWTLIRSDENLGIIKGRNLGAQHVTAEYFLNIDNDQYPGEGWLDSLFALHEKGFGIVGVEAWKLHPPKSGGELILNNTTQSREYFPYKRCTKPTDSFTYIGCGGMLIPTSIYQKIGLFDERFSPAYFEDPDFSFRCHQSGISLGWDYSHNVHHLEHQTIQKQKLFSKNEQFMKSWKLFKEKWSPYFPKEPRMKK